MRLCLECAAGNFDYYDGICDHATKCDFKKYIANRIIRSHSSIDANVVERPDTHKLNKFYEVICNHRADVTTELIKI